MLKKAFSTGFKLLQPQMCASFSKATIKLPSVDCHLINPEDIPTETVLTTKQAKSMLRDMTTIRRMEVACDKLYKQAAIRGFLHLYDGQEAIAVGHDNALTRKDAFIGAYRIHGWAYMRGFSVHEIIAEMMGKITGGSDGKGGSMHYYKKDT